MWRRNHSQNIFWKIKSKHISESIVQSFIQFIFIVYQVASNRKIFKINFQPLAFISHKAFLKDNYRSGNGLLASYSAQFLKKIASLVIFLLTDQILMSGCRYFVINWAICVLQLFVFYVVMSNFETNLIFLIRPFFLHSQKFNTNI